MNLSVEEREREFDRQERRLVAVLAGIGDAVIATDVENRILFINDAAARLTGWMPSEAKGKRVELLLRLDADPSNGMTELVSPEEEVPSYTSLSDSTVVITKERELIHVEGTMSRIQDASGRPEGTIYALRDRTIMQRLSETIDYQASHDTLTGLYNRSFFSKRLPSLVEQARSGAVTHALIYIDIDQFKVVNDTWGHLAGDELLRHATSIITGIIRSSDLAARVGSDEFGILLERIAPEPARLIAERLLSAINSKKFLWEGRVLSLSSSIGVVSIDQKSKDIYSLLAAANDACYLARDLGGNRIQVYEDEESLIRKRRGEMRWLSRIKTALEEGGFKLYYQPIVPLLDPGKIMKCEILLRLIDSNGKPVMPADFLPAAERYNLMPAIDRWVIAAVFDRYRRIMQSANERLKSYVYCINLSGVSVADGSLLNFIKAAIENSGVPPEKFCFEVTETAAIGNFGSASRFIRALKDLGCTFSLDDFGSGFSSFNYLKNLPVDYLKIDGSFIKDMMENPVDQAMVEAINTLGKLMNVETIAEFVTSAGAMSRLKEIGVDYAQGYEIGPPVPFDD